MIGVARGAAGYWVKGGVRVIRALGRAAGRRRLGLRRWGLRRREDWRIRRIFGVIWARGAGGAGSAGAARWAGGGDARAPTRLSSRCCCCQVLAVSSAGVTFSMLKEVPPLTLAAWRLQLTSVLLGVGAAAQGWRMPREKRRLVLEQSWLLAASGSFLCLHFGAWVYSVETTSLTHSLLFVSATPLFLAAGAWLLRKPISRGELAGTGLGALGAVLLATAAAASDAGVTVRGDLAALAASLAFVGYLLIGRRLRQWMPLFVYAFAGERGARGVGGGGGGMRAPLDCLSLLSLAHGLPRHACCA